MNSLQQARIRKCLPLFLGVMALAPCCALAQGAKVGEFTLTPERVAVPRVATPSATAGLVLRQVVAGKTTLAAAWEQKLLGREDVIGLLSRPQLNGVSQERQSEVRIGLAGLLAGTLAEGEAGLEEAAQWNAEVRLSLADYYRGVRDKRAVPLYQGLLQELDVQIKKSGLLRENLIDPLANLAHFYLETGDPRQAIQTWERAEKYSREPAWLVATLIETARASTQAGDVEKARTAYDQIPQHGYGWYTALAYYDQALPLMDAGKLDEAKAILSRPLQAREQVVEGTIALNAWLASVSYQEGNLEEAMRYGQLAVQAGEGATLTRDSIRNLYSLARDVYNRAGGWRIQPIQSDVKEVIIKTNPSQPNQPLYARFRIKTYGDTSVTATVDNPNLQVRILPVDNWQEGGFEEEKEVVIQTSGIQNKAGKPVTSTLKLISSVSVGKSTLISIKQE